VRGVRYVGTDIRRQRKQDRRSHGERTNQRTIRPADCTGILQIAAGPKRPRTGLSASNRRRELDRAIHIARGAHAHAWFMEQLLEWERIAAYTHASDDVETQFYHYNDRMSSCGWNVVCICCSVSSELCLKWQRATSQEERNHKDGWMFDTANRCKWYGFLIRVYKHFSTGGYLYTGGATGGGACAPKLMSCPRYLLYVYTRRQPPLYH